MLLLLEGRSEGRVWDWEIPIPDAIDGHGNDIPYETVVRRLRDGHELWVATEAEGFENFVIHNRCLHGAAFLSKDCVARLLREEPLEFVGDSPTGKIFKRKVPA